MIYYAKDDRNEMIKVLRGGIHKYIKYFFLLFYYRLILQSNNR